jgi:sporulation protein YlmC with PRC-barrel domain
MLDRDIFGDRTHTQKETSMNIKVILNDRGNPVGKVADVELHFTEGPLVGLKLIGFSVWERRTGAGLNVTFPARQYSVNGERRSFALLRPIEDFDANEAIRHRIIEAYEEAAKQLDA